MNTQPAVANWPQFNQTKMMFGQYPCAQCASMHDSQSQTQNKSNDWVIT